MGPSIADEEELWSFSAALFKSDAVEEWCLQWQSLWNIDISLMFWAAWIEHARGVRVGQSTLSAAINSVSIWRNGLIIPARAARKFVKASAAGVTATEYEKIKQHLRSVELIGERIEQRALLSLHISTEQSPSDESNMSCYLGLVGEARSTEDSRKLTRINQLAGDLIASLGVRP